MLCNRTPSLGSLHPKVFNESNLQSSITIAHFAQSGLKIANCSMNKEAKCRPTSNQWRGNQPVLVGNVRRVSIFLEWKQCGLIGCSRDPHSVLSSSRGSHHPSQTFCGRSSVSPSRWSHEGTAWSAVIKGKSPQPNLVHAKLLALLRLTLMYHLDP